MSKICFTQEQINTHNKIVKLSEECGEVVQICSKYILHGSDSFDSTDTLKTTNKELLSKEIGDILAVVDILKDDGLIDIDTMIKQRDKKFFKLKDILND